eukprot:317859_1
MKYTIKAIAKSRFVIVLLSTIYVFCVVAVYTLTIVQWGGTDIETVSHLDLTDEQALKALAGPIQIKLAGSNGIWGWPFNNSILRLVSFTLLTVSIVISWILILGGKFGCGWKINLFFMFAVIATCFSSFSVDCHQIQQSRSFCYQSKMLCGDKRDCECIVGTFVKVPIMNLFTILCASILRMIYMARSDSKRYKIDKHSEKKKRRYLEHEPKSLSTTSVSVSQNEIDGKDSYCSNNTFDDNDPEIDMDEEYGMYGGGAGTAYD